MSDKVQLIKEEIERRIKEGSSKNDISEGALALDSLLDFIDSLPKKSGCEVNFTTKNEDLEEEIQRAYYDKSLYDADNLNRQDFNNIASHFAEWQKQQMMKDVFIDNYIVHDGRIELEGDPLPSVEPIILLPYPKFKPNDKVKIIIIKEEQ